jgi:HEAT repeat protein
LTSLGEGALVQSNAQVIVMTRDQDPAVRGLARQALGIIARATRPHMAEVRPLPLEDFATKVVEEQELKKASKKLSVDALLALTRDGRETVRVNAWRGLQALGSLDETGALQAAVACKDGDPVVRREAALTLRGCPEDALPQVLPVLVQLSRDPEKAPAQAAKQIVYSFGKKAVPHLLHLFAAREGHVNSEAVKLAVALSDDSTPAILAALDSPLPLVRENALQALGQIGGKALDGALDRVMARTADSHDGARLAALQAVMQMTPATWSKPLSDKRLGTVRDVAKRMSREDSLRIVREAAVTLIGHLDLAGA